MAGVPLESHVEEDFDRGYSRHGPPQVFATFSPVELNQHLPTWVRENCWLGWVAAGQKFHPAFGRRVVAEIKKAQEPGNAVGPQVDCQTDPREGHGGQLGGKLQLRAGRKEQLDNQAPQQSLKPKYIGDVQSQSSLPWSWRRWSHAKALSVRFQQRRGEGLDKKKHDGLRHRHVGAVQTQRCVQHHEQAPHGGLQPALEMTRWRQARRHY